MFLNYFLENKHLYIYYNYRILNMSHWWFSHTNTQGLGASEKKKIK